MKALRGAPSSQRTATGLCSSTSLDQAMPSLGKTWNVDVREIIRHLNGRGALRAGKYTCNNSISTTQRAISRKKQQLAQKVLHPANNSNSLFVVLNTVYYKSPHKTAFTPAWRLLVSRSMREGSCRILWSPR